MVSLGKNHRLLALVSFAVFTMLSILVAVAPAHTAQESNAALPGSSPLSEAEQRGLNVYIQEGCVACHTQQVRNIEMDNVWGERPSIPADYYHSKQRMDTWRQTPSVLGSERTGPDLTSIGQRNPSDTWHFMHLYNPRIVVPESIMPGYPWLFKTVDEAADDDAVINLPPSLNPTGRVVVATQDAKDLVAYLLSLKQTKLPSVEENFIPADRKKVKGSTEIKSNPEMIADALPDGEALYQATCSACHQPTGEGLPGAFPPLKGSAIVTDKNPETLIRIIIEGYDARPEFATMPPFGEQLTDAQIAAIVNYERNHWGNKADPVDASTVSEIRSKKLNQ